MYRFLKNNYNKEKYALINSKSCNGSSTSRLIISSLSCSFPGRLCTRLGKRVWADKSLHHATLSYYLPFHGKKLKVMLCDIFIETSNLVLRQKQATNVATSLTPPFVSFVVFVKTFFFLLKKVTTIMSNSPQR